MKSLLIAFFVTSTVSAQAFQPTIPNSPIVFGKTTIFSPSVVAASQNIGNPQPVFFVYNPVLGTSANLGHGHSHANALLNFENMHRGVKVDSFNPNGASNLGEGLVSGALNLIFNGNSGKSAYIRF